MLRSLAAVIVAVIIGLAVASGVERIALRLSGLSPAGFDAFLIAGWGVAAFASAALALLIGRRWAPLGWLATAAMGLQAVIVLSGGGLGLLMWPLAIAAVGLGGWGAVKLCRASNTPSAKKAGPLQ